MSDEKWTDPIVEEIHQIRQEIAARFDYDLDAIFQDVLKRQEESRKSGRVIVSPPKKKSADQPAA
jgi:hypothetical protein